jgi:hypothetical protein
MIYKTYSTEILDKEDIDNYFSSININKSDSETDVGSIHDSLVDLTGNISKMKFGNCSVIIGEYDLTYSNINDLIFRLKTTISPKRKLYYTWNVSSKKMEFVKEI